MASINVSWTPTSTNSINQEVQYKASTSSTWITFATVSPTDTSATITGLSDNIIYDVRIVNNCQYGQVPSYPDQVISLPCPVINVNPLDTSVDYSFTGSLTGVSSYTVQLLDTNNTILQTQVKTPAATVTGTFTGLFGTTTYKIKLVIVSSVRNHGCTPLTLTTTTPVIPCGSSASYSGGQTFPTEYAINLGPGVGDVTLTYDAFTVPDKFIVIYDGVEVINTGYRGDASEQGALDANLIGRGLPPEPIVGPGAGTANFTKSTATTTATVQVWAPLLGTAWNFTLACPVDSFAFKWIPDYTQSYCELEFEPDETGIIVADIYDTGSDVELYAVINTPGITENNLKCHTGANFAPPSLSGTPASCLILASDFVVGGGSLDWRFEYNIAKLLTLYPLIEDFTVEIRGIRNAGAAGIFNGAYSIKGADQGNMTMSGSPGSYIPSNANTSDLGIIGTSYTIQPGSPNGFINHPIVCEFKYNRTTKVLIKTNN